MYPNVPHSVADRGGVWTPFVPHCTFSNIGPKAAPPPLRGDLILWTPSFQKSCIHPPPPIHDIFVEDENPSYHQHGGQLGCHGSQRSCNLMRTGPTIRSLCLSPKSKSMSSLLSEAPLPQGKLAELYHSITPPLA